jgi:hypothetical protein
VDFAVVFEDDVGFDDTVWDPEAAKSGEQKGNGKGNKLLPRNVCFPDFRENLIRDIPDDAFMVG